MDIRLARDHIPDAEPVDTERQADSGQHHDAGQRQDQADISIRPGRARFHASC